MDLVSASASSASDLAEEFTAIKTLITSVSPDIVMNDDYGKEDGERMGKIDHFVVRHRELSAKCKELASESVSGVVPFYDFHLYYFQGSYAEVKRRIPSFS